MSELGSALVAERRLPDNFLHGAVIACGSWLIPRPCPSTSRAARRRRGVVVIQEAFGVNDHIEDVCRRFADEGYLAVAPHLFHRTGDPKLSYDEAVRAEVMEHMGALTADNILTDVDEALAYLGEAGIADSNTGVVGFCMGGTVTLAVATMRDVGAGVTFYGGGVTAGRFGFPALVELAPQLRAPWLGLFGDLDQGIPVDDVEQLRAAAATAAVPTEVVRYPDAGHGFHCDQRIELSRRVRGATRGTARSIGSASTFAKRARSRLRYIDSSIATNSSGSFASSHVGYSMCQPCRFNHMSRRLSLRLRVGSPCQRTLVASIPSIASGHATSR